MHRCTGVRVRVGFERERRRLLLSLHAYRRLALLHPLVLLTLDLQDLHAQLLGAPPPAARAKPAAAQAETAAAILHAASAAALTAARPAATAAATAEYSAADEFARVDANLLQRRTRQYRIAMLARRAGRGAINRRDAELVPRHWQQAVGDRGRLRVGRVQYVDGEIALAAGANFDGVANNPAAAGRGRRLPRERYALARGGGGGRRARRRRVGELLRRLRIENILGRAAADYSAAADVGSHAGPRHIWWAERRPAGRGALYFDLRLGAAWWTGA